MTIKQIIIGVASILVGVTLVSLTVQANPGYGFINSWFAVFLGVLITTSGPVFVHAQNEAKRNIKGFHWKRALYRGLLLAVMPFAIVRSLIDPQFFFMYLANCFWFGIWFDPLYNRFRSQYTGIQFKWYYTGSQALYDIIGHKLKIAKYMIVIEIIAFFYFTLLFFQTV